MQGAFCDVNFKILKTLHPKLVPLAMFLHWKSQKELRGPEDSASAEDKVEFMVGSNMLLWQSKRFVTDKQFYLWKYYIKWRLR